MSSKNMSVQERIKALNLQQQSGSDGSSVTGNTPPRKQTRQPQSPRGGSFNPPSPIRPTAAAAAASPYARPRSPAVVPFKSAQSTADTTTALSYTRPIPPALVFPKPTQPIAATYAASSYPRPSPAVVSSTPMLPEAKNRSPSKSPPSEKAQLFKAAKVIQKSFNAEANILSRSRAARAAAADRTSRQGLTKPRPEMERETLSKQQQQSQHRQSEQQHQPQHQPLQQHEQHDARDYLGSSLNLSSESDFELDATAALNFWKTQGITNEGPLSFRQAKKRGTITNLPAASENIAQRTSVSSIQEGGDDPSQSYYEDADEKNAPEYLDERGSSSEKYFEEDSDDDATSTFSQQQDSNTISITSESIPVQGGIHGEAAASLSHPQDEEEPKPPSPPDIVRTVNTDSDMEQSYEVEDENLNERSYQYSRDKSELEEDQHIVHEEEEYEDVHEEEEQGDVHEPEEEYDGCDHEQQDDCDQQEEQDDYDQHEEQPVFDHHEDQFVYEQQEMQHDYDGEPLDNVTAEHSIEVDIIEPQETSSAAEFVSLKTSEDDVLPTSTEESKPSSRSYGSIDNDEAVESGKSILTDLVPMKTKHRPGRSKSAGGGAQSRTTYRAYARRSRLRTSPRAMSGVTSPDLTAEMMKDDFSAQSVVSAGSTTYSTSSQTSTSMSLSTRATRFLKDKKDKRKQGAPAAAGEAATGSEAGKAALGQPQSDMAKYIAQNLLRGKALKARIKHRRALASGTAAASMTNIELQKAGVDVGLKSDFPTNKEAPNTGGRRMAMDTRRPQTIDLKPAIVPKMDHRLSGLNRDEGGQGQHQHHQQWQHQHPAVMDHTTPAINPSRRDIPPSAQLKQPYESQAGYDSTQCHVAAQQQISQTRLLPQLQKQPQRGAQYYSKKAAGKEKYVFDHASSMDSGSYSELKAKDLINTADRPQQQQQQESDTAKTKTSSTSFSPSATSFSPTNQSESGATTLGSNPDVFATFPRGEGKSFDNGCQVFDALNPLIESAFNALNVSTGPGSGRSQSSRPSSASNIFSSSNAVARRVMSNTFCNDAPSDEDVAIEVEYVEQGEERSYAETDSIYSMSTRDMDESQ